MKNVEKLLRSDRRKSDRNRILRIVLQPLFPGRMVRILQNGI